MTPGTKIRAIARFNRAWKEARYILERRSHQQRRKLLRLQGKREKQAEVLGEVFSSEVIADIACRSCNRCCTKAAMDSGYYTHAEREALLNTGIDISSFGAFMVDKWPEGYEEPPERCLFLSVDGCNIPLRRRSAQCLTYVCRDRLGPQLVQLSLIPRYNRSKKELLRTTKKIAGLKAVPYDSNRFGVDLGHG